MLTEVNFPAIILVRLLTRFKGSSKQKCLQTNQKEENKRVEKTSKAIEDYLEALLMLEEKKALLGISSVSALLKVSMPAASQMAGELKALGYIEKEPYGDMVLTAEGRMIANRVYHRHKVLCRYLESIGVSPATAEEDCCQIEHVISKETFSAIEKQLEKTK
jgi:DtxR family Mn-dependent transcriptional regulator